MRPDHPAPRYGPDLRVYLCGQRSFGAEVLRELLARPDVLVAGVSSPAESERGEDACRRVARLNGLPWLPAGQLRAPLLPAGTDLIVAAHSHDVIGRKTRRAAAHGAIGYHPSLLPLHRGRDAVKWTIRDGDRVAGGSVYWLTDVIDGGPIAAQDWCFVRPGDDASSLWRRELFPMGVRLLLSVVTDVINGSAKRVLQDHRLATWEPSMSPPPLFHPELPELPAPARA